MDKLFYVEFYDIDGRCIFLDNVKTFSISESSFFVVDIDNDGFRYPISLIAKILIEVKE